MKLIWYLHLLISIINILCYFIVRVSPQLIPVSGFFGMAIPVLWIGQLLFFILWMYSGNFLRALLPLITCAIGYNYLVSTISFSSAKEALEGNTISVTSANVRIFNAYKHLKKDKPESAQSMISFFKELDSDVVCLMEYYNSPKESDYHSTDELSANFKHHYFKSSLVNKIGAEFGQVIFSRFPIVNTGFVEFENSKYNQAIYVDLKKGMDTVRVYNVHLQSMSIEERVLFDEKTDEESIKRKVKDTFFRLLGGFKARAIQVDKILDNVKSSPYPVIVCADLNDLPYSYSYLRLKGYLDNAFEKRGLGFGSTYNGKIPFLRIDNQFSSSDLEVLKFTVNREMDLSDHFPIQAVYNL